MKIELEIPIREYIDLLTDRYPGIKEVWLFGSRANNWVHEKSDWDFIVKSDEKTCEYMRADKDLKNDANKLMVKLLVGPNKEGYFQNPWAKERLSFKKDSLNWREIGPDLAEYKACDLDVKGEEAKAKGLPESVTSFTDPHAKAYRIWPQ